MSKNPTDEPDDGHNDVKSTRGKRGRSDPKNQSPDPTKHTQTYMGELSREYRAELVQKTKRRRVQPYKRTEKIEQKLWERICCGESLQDICSDPKMPAYSTVAKWMAADSTFESYINQAYMYQGRKMADVLKALADGKDQSLSIEERKLQAKIYMWMMAKYHRKLFGDSMQHEVTDTRPVINLPMQFGAWAGSVVDGQLTDQSDKPG